MRARGVDVSSVQAQCDWETFAKGDSSGPYDFSITKATEGSHGVDPWFVRHALGARAAGLVTVGYHYITATSAIVDQASNAYQAISAYDLGGLFVDLESPPPERWIPPITGQWLVRRCLEFSDRMSRLLGGDSRIKVYSYPDWLRHLYACPELDELEKRFGLWIASYHDEKHEPKATDEPTLPTATWSSWDFWQWSGNGGTAAPGIPCVVDHDVYRGTREELFAWAAGQTFETAPTDPAPEGQT